MGYNGGLWNGEGITSSTAANDPTHLTALGVILNTNGTASQAWYSTFDGASVTSTDVLIKYTYYGDTNLDGVIDGSDYSRIDNGYLTHLTGWASGDFNYDGVVNGSDYTLIDNAFNMQGASLAASIASPQAVATAQIAAPKISRTNESAPAHAKLNVRSGKSGERTRNPAFAPNIFSTGTPINFANGFEDSVEVSMQKKDVLDALNFAR